MIKILRIVFFFVYFPLQWYQKNKYNKLIEQRKNEAIDKARVYSLHYKRKYYVSKMADEFFIGTSQQMKATQRKAQQQGLNWYWTKNIVKC